MRRGFTRLLAMILLMMALPVTAHAEQTASVRLRDEGQSAALAFRGEDMLPGDSVEKTYVVTAPHSQPTTLYFQVDTRSDNAVIARWMHIQVTAEGEEIYNGPMTACISRPCSLPVGRDETAYTIRVYLPKEAGNDCQNAVLYADFRWWYMDGVEQNKVTIQPVAEVLLDSKYPKGSDYSFTLTDSKGNTYVARDVDGFITFPPMTFTQLGEYTFTITQIPGSDPDIIYDTSVYQASVIVYEGRDGNWAVSITYTRNGQFWPEGRPRFANVTKGQPVPSDPSTIVPENPKMGDSFPLVLLSIIAVTSGALIVCLFLLWKECRKEAEQ